jgi:hypothetical protein
MADTITMEILTADCDAKLKAMGERMAAKALKNALTAAGLVFKDALIAAAPERTDDLSGGNALPPGALKEDIGGDVLMRPEKEFGIVRVGPSKLTEYVARWLEQGHDIKTHGKSRSGRTVIGHVPPHKFMAPAFDASSQQALDVFTESIMGAVAAEESAE